jgi:hypothetical protein
LEAISEKAIGDIAKLGGAMSSAMTALGVSLGPRTPETLIEEVGRLPGVRELELSTTRRAVHRVLAMIESHYQGLDRTALSGGWDPSVSDNQCDELEVDCAAFAREMADAALKDLELLPQNESEAPGVPRPRNKTCHKLFYCNNLNRPPGHRVARLFIWRYVSSAFERPRTTAPTRSRT